MGDLAGAVYETTVPLPLQMLTYSPEAEAALFGHVSPNKFSKFNLKRSGDTLGSAFGNGIYLAEHPSVLNSYAELIKRNGYDKLFKYDVDVPDEQLAKMLKIHRPMSEQPELIKRLAKDLSTDKVKYENPTSLLRRLRKSKDFENKMLDYGIPGIRHVDQRSMFYGPGTENLAVFDPEILKILGVSEF
jgi:hypothetical protein